ncbi:NAD(P)H-dependent oxidoreductase subunit E [Cyanobium sp. ATX 6F1]|uniref:NADH-quinone oxidoreductase subunit NuoE family protein n=1 Tax=unclassified Cyanobium TaxID=2627006 RepID=UPI0020CFE572|nr:NAD(P)H-dependent oxidoreductase subunit E [Cyanobium sp. ATX 6F1]MCP9915209.1 NAD(P)H-dependent oxidoreductase subunit E [Cyanobium sp. ATX 6F1]
MSDANTEASTKASTETFAELEPSLRECHRQPSALIELLNRAQELYGHLSGPLLRHLAVALELPLSRVYGTASFYHLFRFQPPAPHQLVVCTGTACHVKGADGLLAALAGRGAEGDQTAGFELSRVRCLGTCGGAPLVVVDGTVWTHQSATSLLQRLRALPR